MGREKPLQKGGRDVAAVSPHKELKEWLSEIRSLEDKLIDLKRELVRQAAVPSEDSEREDDSTFLLLQASATLLAAPISYVEEVVQIPQMSRLPSEVWAVAGLIDYHGEMMAVIDLSELIGTRKTAIDADKALVICRLDPLRFALLVDEATDVHTISYKEIQVAEQVLPGVLKAAGVLKVGAQTAIILDMWSIALAAQVGVSGKRLSETPEAEDQS